MTKEIDNLFIALNFIEEIVSELPHIQKRSELKVRVDDILRLTAIVRRKVHLLEVEEQNEHYIPNFSTSRGGKQDAHGNE
jgi:hypothetical protein